MHRGEKRGRSLRAAFRNQRQLVIVIIRTRYCCRASIIGRKCVVAVGCKYAAAFAERGVIAGCHITSNVACIAACTGSLAEERGPVPLFRDVSQSSPITAAIPGIRLRPDRSLCSPKTAGYPSEISRDVAPLLDEIFRSRQSSQCQPLKNIAH